VKPTHEIALVVALALGGCAHTKGQLAGGGDAPAQLKQRLKECEALVQARKLDQAKRCAESVEQGGDYKLARWASYTRVTALLYEGDFQGSQQVFEAMMQRDRAHADAENEAWGRNATTWLRWGVHDLAGALGENERVRQIIEASKLSQDSKRSVLLHYWWDRAYLLLDVAMQKPSDAAAAQAADDARKRYDQLARQPDQHDGLAVLAAYFAVRRGDAKAARDAAITVDPAKDDDVQDLYILWLAFDAAGDRVAADDIRRRIEKSYDYPMKPLILRELGATTKK